MSSIEKIAEQQRRLQRGEPSGNPSYELFLQSVEQIPDTLLVGCIDARLPLGALGPPHGSEFIHRVPAAYVDSGSSSFATSLALAIERKQVKDIVVMGHTDCAAIKEYQRQDPEMPEVARHFCALDATRDRLGGMDAQATCGRLEEATVCESIRNLLTYPRVAKAVAAGEVKLHGWIFDVQKAREGKPFISSLIDLQTCKFQPLREAGAGVGGPSAASRG